ncbi:MAG: GNAT family N-acetyltransferase [Povalibacter sp.]
MNIDWHWASLSELSAIQLYAIFAARQAVFVVEQTCAYQDLDGLDFGADHLIGWNGDEVAAYLRILDPGIRFSEPSIGRVLTTRNFRSSGVGRALMRLALERTDARFPRMSVRISAQAHLESFYGSLGFSTASEPYLEDGIPHVEMLRSPL